MIDKVTAQAAKRALLARFGDLPGINGIGIAGSKGNYTVKVNLTSPDARPDDLPNEVDGVPVEVAVVGGVALR